MFVETRCLTKRYPSVTALDQCSLAIERGEIFGLLGPNGAGKTTLLRLLLGYLRPTQGSARIDALDCLHQSVQVRSKVSYLPGDARLFRTMRGYEALRFFSSIRSGSSLQRSMKICTRLDLDVSRMISQMSTGMRQKLALAIALAPDVPLIILDEPTSSLDPTMRLEVQRLVAEVCSEGRTVLFSSHVLSEVEAVCDRVAVLRRGELVHTQVISDLRHQHRIHLEMAGDLPELPAELKASIKIEKTADQEATLETAGQLAPLLGWLASLPLQSIRIEPIGLQSVYEQFHREHAS